MNGMTRRTFIQSSAALAAATVIGAPAGAAEAEGSKVAFEAGVARRDITPEPGVRMWGYSDRQGPGTGTLDPLNARALVLRSGSESIAIVTLDLGRVPMKEPCNRIRQRAAAKGIKNVVLCASHTHQGPGLETDDAPHAMAIEKGIGDAIEEAAGKLRPARIGVGRTTVDIAHNRRIVKDGRCYMLWRNEERIPTSPVDKEAGILRVDDESGKTITVLVNYSCHPVVLGPSNLQYSADWVGEMARVVAEKTGAECMFLQGACGDINPYLDKTPIDKGGVESMRSTGRAAGDAVLGVFDSIKTSTPAAPSLIYEEKPVKIGTRWDFSQPEVRKIFQDMYGPLFEKYMKDLTPDFSVPLGVLVLNGDLALSFMPGELFTQYQLDLKKGSPVKDTFLCGYANEFHLYFPTIRDAAAGGYGGSVATYVGVGAGDRLVTESLIGIGRLAGQLRPAPIPDDFKVVDYEAAKA